MSSIEQFFPNWVVWAFFAIGYLFFANLVGRLVVKVFRPLWREAQAREKRIELASAIAAVLALFISAMALAYTVRQVDAATDRIAALEKALDAMKAKPEASKP